MNELNNFNSFIIIFSIICGILYALARMVLRRGIFDDFTFQRRVKEIIDQLDSYEKEKYREEKRRTLHYTILISMIVTIIFHLFWIFGSPNQPVDPEVLHIIILSDLGLFALFFILIYLLMDEQNQKKWLKKQQSNYEDQLFSIEYNTRK